MFHLIDSRARKAGAVEARCPACGRETRLQMISSFESIHVVCVPAGSFLKEFFAVCPACSSVFAVDNAAYTALKGGNGSFINAEHLTLVSGPCEPV